MSGPARSMETDPDALLGLARRAAEAAGGLLLERLATAATGVGSKSTPTDMVSDVDRASEELVRSIVRAERPADAFLGEEGGEQQGDTAGSAVRWVVDPLDGTVNYLYRFPAFCVSVAAEIGGTVAVGVVHDPQRRETFWAVRGGGAFRRGPDDTGPEPLHVSDADQLAGALIGTGFAYAAEVRRRQGRVVAGLLPEVRDIRRAGSAALDLCWVASGRLDGYYEEGTRHWDRAAGALIAAEAGAWVGNLQGGLPSEEMVVAAAPGIAGALVRLIAGLGSGS